MQEQKRVLITGTNRGIGFEFVQQYVQAGWRVYAACRSPERALELNRLAAENRDTLSLHPLDVTNNHQIEGVKAVLVDTPLDLLINNAGVLGPKLQSFGHTDTDAWAYTMKVNTVAPLKIIEAFVDNLSYRGGIAASLSSRMGSIGDNSSGGYYIYRSSKAALNAALKSASVDLNDRGIRVVALHPGWVKTDMGGADAELDIADSVSQMRALLDDADLARNGAFLDLDGSDILW